MLYFYCVMDKYDPIFLKISVFKRIFLILGYVLGVSSNNVVFLWCNG